MHRRHCTISERHSQDSGRLSWTSCSVRIHINDCTSFPISLHTDSEYCTIVECLQQNGEALINLLAADATGINARLDAELAFALTTINQLSHALPAPSVWWKGQTQLPQALGERQIPLGVVAVEANTHRKNDFLSQEMRTWLINPCSSCPRSNSEHHRSSGLLHSSRKRSHRCKYLIALMHSDFGSI